MGWVTVRERDGKREKEGYNVVQWSSREKTEEKTSSGLGRVNARHDIYVVPINHPAVNFCTIRDIVRRV